MQHTIKVLLNTIASFSRVIINAVATLVATRIALRVLGDADFGLYNLLAGVVMLFSFVNGTLMISAQRFFSIAIGENNYDKLTRYYNASISIHLLLGLFIVLLLFGLRFFLFDSWLNITPEQAVVGVRVYDIMIISSFITIITIPYSAIMNAHEDMVMMAFTDILSCIVKLMAAIMLLFINHDRLLIYSTMMLGATMIKAVIEYIWSKNRYSEIYESIIYIKDLSRIKEMFGFVGWNTLGSTSVLIRNQGVALVLNIFFGTVVNTAYGIANQINSMVLSFSSTLTTVFSPVIIQAKGSGNEERMRQIAVFSSKMSFLLSSIIALPILLFLRQILNLWLIEYPDITFEFCYLIVLSFLILQLYPGINRAIYASGKIKLYQIAMSILLVSIIPIGILLFRSGFPPYAIVVAMLFSQIGTLLVTNYYGVKYCGFTYRDLFINIVFKPVLIFITVLAISYFIIYSLPLSFFSGQSRNSIIWLILFGIVIDAIFVSIYFHAVLNTNEKKVIKGLLSMLKNRIQNKCWHEKNNRKSYK